MVQISLTNIVSVQIGSNEYKGLCIEDKDCELSWELKFR